MAGMPAEMRGDSDAEYLINDTRVEHTICP
jgi:hypothetical protein